VKIAYVARQDGTDMRISKECNSLLAAGHDVTLIGWDRTPGQQRPDPMPDVPRRLLRREASFGPRAVARSYPAFVGHIARQLRELRPDVVHCVNEDLAGVALALRRRMRFRVVCDLFDSVALRWSAASRPMRAAADMAARFVHERSDALIATDAARAALLRRHAYIVPNYPVDPGPELALTCLPSSGRLRVYVGGTLTRNRGLSAICTLLDSGLDLQPVTAGWTYDRFASDFTQRPEVEHHGLVTPQQSLKLAASCHVILCFYEPSNRNNIMASPNKIYDAMCVGRPVIISEETLVARWVTQQRLGYAVPYHDTSALASLIGSFPRGSRTVSETAVRLRSVFETGYSWKVAEQSLFAAYASLS
jgi:hypothetical protein